MRPIVFSLALVSSIFLGQSAFAQIKIGANFTGRNNSGPDGATVNDPPAYNLAPSEVAGVVPQANWNNIANAVTNNNATSGPLNDSTGAATAVTVEYHSNDSWNSNGGQTTPDEKLNKGFIKAGTNSSLTLTLHNVPAGTYDLIATTVVNSTGSQDNITVGSTTYYVQEEDVFDGTYTQGLNTNPAGTRDVDTDYVKFSSISPSVGGDITLTLQHIAVSDGGAIDSLQLIAVPEPATLSLLCVGAAGLFLRRRRR